MAFLKFIMQKYVFLIIFVNIYQNCIMETSVRGYLLKEIVQKNRLFTVYNAEHAVLTGQKLRITIINELFANDPDIKSAFEQSIFKLAFAEHDNIVENIDMLEENHKLAILSKTDDFSKLDVLL